MVVDVFQSSLLVHEQRMKGQKEEEQVLNVGVEEDVEVEVRNSIRKPLSGTNVANLVTFFLMAQETKEIQENCSKHTVLFLDSGCNNHMIGNKE
jgi:indole-3-glycerol phosphate synthase